MAAVEHRRPVTHHFVRLAWVAVALTPVGFALALFVGFLGGGSGSLLGGALLAGLVLAAPTAATALTVRAARAGERIGTVNVVSQSLLIFTVLGLLLIVSFAAWVIAVALYLVGALTVLAYTQRKAANR